MSRCLSTFSTPIPLFLGLASCCFGRRNADRAERPCDRPWRLRLRRLHSTSCRRRRRRTARRMIGRSQSMIRGRSRPRSRGSALGLAREGSVAAWRWPAQRRIPAQTALGVGRRNRPSYPPVRPAPIRGRRGKGQRSAVEVARMIASISPGSSPAYLQRRLRRGRVANGGGGFRPPPRNAAARIRWSAPRIHSSEVSRKLSKCEFGTTRSGR